MALCSVLLLQARSPTARAEALLRAGLAKLDITPTKPVTMSGYESRKGLSEGVHDPLSARAVALEHNGQRLVLVSTDVIGFYNDTAEPLRKAILEACRLEASELFLTAIHTHSAPALALDPGKGHSNNVEYTQGLRTQLVRLAEAALGNLRPVEVSVGAGSSPVGANRREVVKEGTGQTSIRLGRNPAAATDREVQVVKLSPPNGGQPTAVLFAYATHSTSLGPRNYVISGDVHGLAEQFVERYWGEGVIAPGFAGTSGDIDPWYRVLPAFNTTNGWIPEPVLLGTMLGQEVVHVLSGMSAGVASGPIRTAFKTLTLPGKPRGGNKVPDNSPPAFLNVTAGRVGNVAFVGLGGEVFNEIGQAIKAASPFERTFVMTHCNGAGGYLPTERSYPEGGYEVVSSPFAPAAAAMVIEETVRLLKEILARDQPAPPTVR